MQFVPLWTDILERPNWKILDLPPDLYRFWSLCLMVAQMNDYVDGTLPDARTLAHKIPGMGQVEAEGLLARLVAAGLIDCIDGGHRMHDWSDWRTVNDTGATRRQRERRAKLKAERDKNRDASRNGHGHVTASSQPVTPQHTTDNKQQTTISIHHPAGAGDDDGVIAFGREACGDRFDLEAVPAMLPGWRAARYSDAWIKDAILCAFCGARPGGMPAYVNKCLRAWKARGGPDPEEVAAAKAKAKYGDTNLPARPAPEELARLAAEIESRPKMTPQQLLEMHRAKQR